MELTETIEAALTQEYEIYLCHNCSDLSLESGESCFFAAFYPMTKEEILHGACECLMKKPCKSDFYLLKGDAAKNRYKEMQENPLWFVNGKCWKLSNEELGKHKQFEEYRLKSRIDTQARRDIRRRIEAFDRITMAKPCTLETDPLNSRCK